MLGIPVAVLNRTDKFMPKKQIGMAVEEAEKDIRLLTTGISQGSPISPTQYMPCLCPLFNELKHKLPYKWCQVSIDEVALVVTGKRLAMNSRIMEKRMQGLCLTGRSEMPSNSTMIYKNSYTFTPADTRCFSCSKDFSGS